MRVLSHVWGCLEFVQNPSRISQVYNAAHVLKRRGLRVVKPLLTCLFSFRYSHSCWRSSLLNRLSSVSVFFSLARAAINNRCTTISAYLLIGDVKWVYLSKARPLKGSHKIRVSKRAHLLKVMAAHAGRFFSPYRNDRTPALNRIRWRNTVHCPWLAQRGDAAVS